MTQLAVPTAKTVKPYIVSVEMGYGHHRAALALANEFGVEISHADLPPLCDADDLRRWRSVRGFYEFTTRLSQVPFLGRPFRSLVEGFTAFPELYPHRDLSAPTWPVKLLNRWASRGFEKILIETVKKSGRPLISTFYSVPIIADLYNLEQNFCVVTDTDINRIWVPANPQESKIHYFVPSRRALRRLLSYGVARENISFTGFPLPGELLGGPELSILRSNLAKRLVRLDPKGAFRNLYKEELDFFLKESLPEKDTNPPLLTFAVGGSGAQAGMVRRFLPSLADDVRRGNLRLGLVAGIRADVKKIFEEAIQDAKLESQLGSKILIIHENSLPEYFAKFNQLLAETDILWTKPSELSFYAALGLPIIFSWPVGHHEKCNRRSIIEAGAGLKQNNPSHASFWIRDWLKDGTLAAAAWSGFVRLPKFGTYRIREICVNWRRL